MLDKIFGPDICKDKTPEQLAAEMLKIMAAATAIMTAVCLAAGIWLV